MYWRIIIKMNNTDLPDKIIDFCSNQKIRYSVWVYDGDEIIKVFNEQKPNTIQIWFQFHHFSYLYWRILQQECLEEVKGKSFFNSFKIKKFLINYLLCNTNIPGISFERQENGKLKTQSFNKIMKIHPRILGLILEQFDLFPKELSKDEERDIEKQCVLLFGKGESVSNPHPFVMTYCNLVSFWDKLGLNYFDIMKLPNDIFNFLKKMIALDNNYHAMSLKQKK